VLADKVIPAPEGGVETLIVYKHEEVNGVEMTYWDGVRDSKLYLVNTPEEWEAFYELLMQQDLVACDTETSGFHWFSGDKIVGMSFGWGLQHFYIPVRHTWSLTGGDPCAQLNMNVIRPQLQAFFAQKDVFTIWHNAKFDHHFYSADDIDVLTPFHDTMFLWHLYDENAPGKLKSIASGWRDIMGKWHKGLVSKDANAKEKEINIWRNEEAKARRRGYTKDLMAKADALQCEPEYQGMGRVVLKKHIQGTEEFLNHPYLGASKEDIHYGMIPVDMMCEYAGMDTFMTWMIYNHVMGKLDMSGPIMGLYINEVRLSRVLTETERSGINVDKMFLEKLRSDLDKQIAEKELSVKQVLGDINLNSNDQLAEALIKQGVKLTRTTDKGKFVVDKKVLNKLKSHQIVKDILDLRADKKINSTYVEGILDKLVDGKILHCNFNQNVSTGRMSGNNPNLMNIPRGNTVIRKAFVPPPGYIYLLADYSQIELRLLAHFSQDPLLLEAYHTGQDVHTRTMCEMFGFEYEAVAEIMKNDPTHPMYRRYKELRSVAKTLNFAVIYGVSAMSLSEQIERPEAFEFASDTLWIAECQDFMDKYVDKYRGVKKFINQTKREVRKEKVIYNSHGRPRHLPHVAAVQVTKDLSYRWMESSAERQGVNYKIQGEAADVFKVAAVRVHDIFKGTQSRLVNFVHDEVQMYLHKDEIHLISKIKAAMEDFNYSIPLVADFAWSETSWADKEEIG
jgi:DNA polymerase I-like protein with 3'-5' exonuclease and polymerase domains